MLPHGVRHYFVIKVLYKSRFDLIPIACLVLLQQVLVLNYVRSLVKELGLFVVVFDCLCKGDK